MEDLTEVRSRLSPTSSEILDIARSRSDDGIVDTLDLLLAIQRTEPSLWLAVRDRFDLQPNCCDRPDDLREEVVDGPDNELGVSDPTLMVLVLADAIGEIQGDSSIEPEVLLIALSGIQGSLAHRALSRGARRPGPRRLSAVLLGDPLPLLPRLTIRLVVDAPPGGDRIVRGVPIASLWSVRSWWQRGAVLIAIMAIGLSVLGTPGITTLAADRAALVRASGHLVDGHADAALPVYTELYDRYPRSRPITAGWLCSLDRSGHIDQAYANAQLRVFVEPGSINLLADPGCQTLIDELPDRSIILEAYGEDERLVYWWLEGEVADLPDGVRPELTDNATHAAEAIAAAACVNHHADLRLLTGMQLTILTQLPFDAPLPEGITGCIDGFADQYQFVGDEEPRIVLPDDADLRLAPISELP